MVINITYQFTAAVWQHSIARGWYFVSLPIELATEIRDLFKSHEEGWGRMPVRVKISESIWDTAIWFDTSLGTYILPIKSEMRKKEKIEKGGVLSVEILL